MHRAKNGGGAVATPWGLLGLEGAAPTSFPRARKRASSPTPSHAGLLTVLGNKPSLSWR